MESFYIMSSYLPSCKLLLFIRRQFYLLMNDFLLLFGFTYPTIQKDSLWVSQFHSFSFLIILFNKQSLLKLHQTINYHFYRNLSRIE